MKQCNKCNIEKDLTEFYFRKDSNRYRPSCKTCIQEGRKEYRDSYYQENKERISEYHKERYVEYRDEISARNSKYKTSERGRKLNRDKQMRRIQLKKQATVHCCKEVYLSCPDNMHVDHIIPLKGEKVSGLHAPWNLQYLNPRENIIKSNSFDGTYVNEGWRNNPSLTEE